MVFCATAQLHFSDPRNSLVLINRGVEEGPRDRLHQVGMSVCPRCLAEKDAASDTERRDCQSGRYTKPIHDLSMPGVDVCFRGTGRPFQAHAFVEDWGLPCWRYMEVVWRVGDPQDGRWSDSNVPRAVLVEETAGLRSM